MSEPGRNARRWVDATLCFLLLCIVLVVVEALIRV